MGIAKSDHTPLFYVFFFFLIWKPVAYQASLQSNATYLFVCGILCSMVASNVTKIQKNCENSMIIILKFMMLFFKNVWDHILNFNSFGNRNGRLLGFLFIFNTDKYGISHKIGKWYLFLMAVLQWTICYNVCEKCNNPSCWFIKMYPAISLSKKLHIFSGVLLLYIWSSEI